MADFLAWYAHQIEFLIGVFVGLIVGAALGIALGYDRGWLGALKVAQRWFEAREEADKAPVMLLPTFPWLTLPHELVPQAPAITVDTPDPHAAIRDRMAELEAMTAIGGPFGEL